MTKVTVADDLSNMDEARTAAGEADVVVLMAGLVATEGADQQARLILGLSDEASTDWPGSASFRHPHHSGVNPSPRGDAG